MAPEEYLALPEEKPYLEYVDGVVLQKPMPNSEHGDLVTELTLELGLYMRRHGGKLRPEARTAIGDLPSYRLPDLAYWAPGRDSGDDSIPSLAIEVRSRTQSMGELRAKCRVFRLAGVETCWLIDPVSRTAEQFEGRHDSRAVDTLTAACLPGFELPLPTLFAVLDPD
jgi:Uma2 family endonuclease